MSTKEVVAVAVLALVVIGAVFGYLAFVRTPEEPSQAPVTQTNEKTVPTATAPDETKKTADYAPIWQAIDRPPAPKPAKPAPPRPPLKLHLKGTVFRKTERIAVIEDSTGRQRLVMEGGTIDGAKVTKIGEVTVTLDVGGKKTVLRLERKPKETPKPGGNPE